MNSLIDVKRLKLSFVLPYRKLFEDGKDFISALNKPQRLKMSSHKRNRDRL